MTEAYIDSHFDGIRNHGSDIENRLDETDCTADRLKEENQKVIDGFGLTGNHVILIDKGYGEVIREVLNRE